MPHAVPDTPRGAGLHAARLHTLAECTPCSSLRGETPDVALTALERRFTSCATRPFLHTLPEPTLSLLFKSIQRYCRQLRLLQSHTPRHNLTTQYTAIHDRPDTAHTSNTTHNIQHNSHSHVTVTHSKTGTVIHFLVRGAARISIVTGTQLIYTHTHKKIRIYYGLRRCSTHVGEGGEGVGCERQLLSGCVGAESNYNKER